MNVFVFPTHARATACFSRAANGLIYSQKIYFLILSSLSVCTLGSRVRPVRLACTMHRHAHRKPSVDTHMHG